MCGIVGIFHRKEAKEQASRALAILQNRGRDCSKAVSLSSTSALGHCLHAIVNRVPQPLQGKGLLVANCEIYNWQELNKKYNFDTKNDADLLLKLFDRFGVTEKKLQELDGVYAFAYHRDGVLYLGRDILGEKPLWFSQEKGIFAFASEKKALLALGYHIVQEVHPRHLLRYDLRRKKLSSTYRSFFSYLPEHQESLKIIRQRTSELLDQSIKKRIPGKKFGLLFSGGIDSTFLAKYFKENGHEVTCYTAVVDTENAVPSDLEAAQAVAKKLGLALKVKKVKMSDIPSYLKTIVPLIEDSNVVKVGVALPFFIACEMAKADGCKVIFSGLGSEEIFAGYERHKQSSNLNQECVSGLLKMYERDLYRDDVLTMANGLELRLPYLDKELVDYALKIPGDYKLREGQTKWILRQIALERGLPREFAERKKTAAQYGSRFDYALGKLAKKDGFISKSAYLRQFYPSLNLRLGVLFSSGKDSASAAYIMKQQNYELSCLITLRSKNTDSYMFQEAGTELVKLQAKAMGIPLVVQATEGEKEEELADLKKALQAARKKYNIDGVVTGALFSTYQRDRIEQIGDVVGLKIFSPLWHKDQEQHLQELLRFGFKAVITKIAAEGLTERWLGREIDLSFIEEIKTLHAKNGLNVAGEGGEFESLVVDGPIFQKKIVLEKVRKEMDSRHSGRLIIEKARLVGENTLAFQKSYTRDTTLILQQLWFKAMVAGVEKHLRQKNPFPLVGIDYVNDGTIEVWQNKEAIQWVKNCLVYTVQENPTSMLRLLQNYKEELPPFYEQCGTLSLPTLIAKIDDLIFGDLLLCFLAEEKRISGKVKELALQLRTEDHFFAKSDTALRQSIANSFPQLNEYSPYLLLSEALSGKIPTKEIQRQRSKQFVVCSNGTSVLETLDAFSLKNPELHFLQENISDSLVKGQSAYPGNVQGTVRILRKKGDLKNVQEGDVIVSPMTTPLFTPALQKVAAIVTDEGGVACHAAVIARELKKPCIVATKIATKVFKDGDFVEVDAEEGTVRKIT